MLKAKTEAPAGFLNSLAARMPRWLTPNAVTLASLAFAALGFAALAFYGNLLAALVLFLITGFADAFDGVLARAQKRVTAFGAFLDGIVDRFNEALLLFGLMALAPPLPSFLIPAWAWLALLLFFGTCMTSFVRAYADHRRVVTDEKSLKAMGGVLERGERLALLFMGIAAALAFSNNLLLVYAIALATVLAVVTVAQRVFFVYFHAKKKSS
jgi:phosphatidylglycerophosphate synthase